MPIKESGNEPLVPIHAACIRSCPGSREMGSVIHSGGFSSRRGVFAVDRVDDDFLSCAAGVERSEVKCAWARAVPRGVRHVVSKIGDVGFSKPPSSGGTEFWHPSTWVFNVNIIRLEVEARLTAPQLKVGNVIIT